MTIVSKGTVVSKKVENDKSEKDIWENWKKVKKETGSENGKRDAQT